MKILGKNKKAFHDYEIIKEYEAGINLMGWEVKSIKAGNFSLKESFVTDHKNELFIYGMHVGVWKFSRGEEMEETRPRKLLLHRREIDRLIGQRQQKGYTIVALDIHLNKGRIKLNLALAKGRKEYEKRDKIKDKEQNRQIERDLKSMKY